MARKNGKKGEILPWTGINVEESISLLKIIQSLDNSKIINYNKKVFNI